MTTIYTNTTVDSNAIWLGSPQQVYRMGLVIKVQVPMQAGDKVLVIGEGEGSVYAYPACTTPLTFSMFATSQLFVFAPGITAPPVVNLADNSGGQPISPPSGMDINKLYNYYTPQVKTGVFTATVTGTYTFAMYWWGGSNDAGTGNAACVYPNTSKITAILFDSSGTDYSAQISALQSQINSIVTDIGVLNDQSAAIAALQAQVSDLQAADVVHDADIVALEDAVAALQTNPPVIPAVVSVPPEGVTIQFVQGA